MGFFNRRAAPVAADTTTTTGAHHEKKGGMFGRKEPRMTTHGAPSHNTRPTFGQWLKATWLDIVTMAIMGAIGLGVYMADPAPSRSFPVIFQDGEIVYPEFAYPLRNGKIYYSLRMKHTLTCPQRLSPSGLPLSWPSSSPLLCS
jgi:diacylglycerol diphosphate phosphatase/phosphatidate phosphatase